MFLAALVVLVAVGFDLLLQAPLAGLVVSVLVLLWTLGALAVGLLKRHGVVAVWAKHKTATLLAGTYFASVGCGLLVGHLVLNEAHALRMHVLRSGATQGRAGTEGPQAAYASFCASRINGRCGWLNYRIHYSSDSTPLDATPPGHLVVDQFFTERVSIALGTGEVLQRRSVD